MKKATLNRTLSELKLGGFIDYDLEGATLNRTLSELKRTRRKRKLRFFDLSIAPYRN